MWERPAWYDRAACRGIGPERFYPEESETLRAGRQVCKKCPVRAECLDYALTAEEGHGMWGGVAARDRRAIRLGQKSKPAA